MAPDLLFRTPHLKSMFAVGSGDKADSPVKPNLELQTIDSGISLRHASALYSAVMTVRPTVAIEIGMANGVSSIAILSALRDSGRGKLISIDPYQETQWKSQGLNNVSACGLREFHEFLGSPDYIALPRLLGEETSAEFAYIDGWHTFDYALLDAWYVDKMLKPGGVMGFNDCGLRSVSKVIRFLRSHRKYSEMDVGLPAAYQASTRVKSLARRVLGLQTNDRYFRKVEQWEPDWNYFHDF